MIAFDFFVPGRPVPWARAAQQGRRKYVAPPQRAHRAAVSSMAACCLPHRARAHAGAVRIDLEFVYPLRAGDAEGDPFVFVPDVDNLIKLVCDALSGIGFRDDRQIFEIRARKIRGAEVGTAVRLEYLDDG